MSTDFNSIVNSAYEQAAKSRANRLAISQGIINKDTVDQSNKSFSYSSDIDLSMEDIANAIKKRNDEKEINNKFTAGYINLPEKEKSEKAKKTENIVSDTQNKIQEVSNNTEKGNNRLWYLSKDLANDARNIF